VFGTSGPSSVGTPHLSTGADATSKILCSDSRLSADGKVQRTSDAKKIDICDTECVSPVITYSGTSS
jgi:hypothetical protein